MKAIIQERYGTADVLTYAEAARPEVGANVVLVRVHASPVNRGNVQLRAGDFAAPLWLPARLMMGLFRPRYRIPGTVFAGRVEAVGAGVSRYAVGDEVFGAHPHGAHAEFVAVPEDTTMTRKPADMSYGDAAAVPYGGVTAQRFLRDLAKVQSGERVLVLGAAGGVGRYAVQIARQLGAEVTGVASGAKREVVLSLGGHKFIDYGVEDFTRSETRYDVVFDTAGATTYGRARKVLATGGRYLSVEPSFGLFFWMLWSSLFGTRRARFAIALGSARELDDLCRLLEEGALRPSIATRFPLESAADAHRLVETGRATGSVMLEITPASSSPAVQ